MPPFVPGLELSRRFYWEAVRPILDDGFPGLFHAAAHIGPGSDVLGFDTEMSTDHGWGPSVTIFLRPDEISRANAISDFLGRRLPHVFYGYPVDAEPIADEPGVFVMALRSEGPVRHRVAIVTLREYILEQLRYDISLPLSPPEWLCLPSQSLRALTTGAAHHDGLAELTALRARLAWYPRDVWFYLLASGWQRISQEEHLMPRAGFVGDEVGSALIGSRLVRDVMTLCFLMERVYPPFPKWFGTAFARLTCAPDLTPILRRAQFADNWKQREGALCQAYEYVAHMHNALGITDPLPEQVSSFYGRPFMVIWGARFSTALTSRITDREVQRIASKGLIGGIDQWSDSTDVRSDPVWWPIARHFYA